MAGPISFIFLDVDDEITSAANRIRHVTEMRVALVLPAGSRLATSRINFRLLAREAQAHAHDLYIVAPEAAARALAASAGMAVYATVRELEDAMEGAGAAEPGGTALASPGVVAVLPDPGPVPRRRDMARPAGERSVPPYEAPAGSGAGDRGGSDERRGSLAGRSAAADLPVVPGVRGRAGHRRAWLGVLAVIVVVAFIGGFAGAQYLPAATIVVTPRVETIGPQTFSVTADPTVGAPDLAAGIVPATQPTIPLDASGTYPATGTKVTETKATGVVRYTSYDTGANTDIPSGSLVSTTDGIEFVTQRDLHLGFAPIGGSVSADIPVTARKPGVIGNVAAGTITVIEAYPKQVLGILKVTNKAVTTGGTHVVILIVSQKDLDKALADLNSQLDNEFDQVMTEPGQILPDVTVFPETKARTPAVLSPDPKTLLGDQAKSFSLAASATGQVTAVDEAAVSALATDRLRASVAAGHDLVKDSLVVTVGPGKAQGADIVFSVKATAQQVRRVVAADLREAIRGRPLVEARTTLEAYGTTTIDLWPGFVSTIPNYDFRIDLTVRDEVPVESAGPGPGSSGASASPSPSASASSGPSAGGSSKPAASGSAKPSPAGSAKASPSAAP
ncbi:MAG TPA: baseplate J/gp47 family protein [Candidatus Limnocylindrales bacterium]